MRHLAQSGRSLETSVLLTTFVDKDGKHVAAEKLPGQCRRQHTPRDQGARETQIGRTR